MWFNVMFRIAFTKRLKANAMTLTQSHYTATPFRLVIGQSTNAAFKHSKILEF